MGGAGGRDGAARAQWLSGQEAERAGAGRARGGGARAAAHCAPAGRRGRPGPVRFPGMVSKGLLRLVSSVNRRRMKLLLAIALLAYAACECTRGGREPIHSRAAAGSRLCGRVAGCAGPVAGSSASTRLNLYSGAAAALLAARLRVGPVSDLVAG